VAIGQLKIHDVFLRDSQDRADFVIAFVLGASGVNLLKALGDHTFLAAGYAVLVLVVYALVAWVGGRVKLEPETVGDNCYYLGFLLTLSSLAYALYRITDSGEGSNEAVNVRELISGFGVALSSTIGGVFLRVLLMQLRSDFVAKDREIRAEVNRAFGDFKRSMSGILQQMKSFSTEAVQLAAERDERIRKSTENFALQQHEVIENASKVLMLKLEKTLLEAVETTAEKVAKSIDAIEVSNRKLGQEMEETAARNIAVKEALIEQELKAIKEFEERRNLLAAEITESVRKMKAHSEELESYSRTVRRAADSMGQRVIPALDGFQKSLDEFQKRLDKLPERRPLVAAFKRWFGFRNKADRS